MTSIQCRSDLKTFILKHYKGPFTNYVYNRKGVGGPKLSIFCQHSYIR